MGGLTTHPSCFSSGFQQVEFGEDAGTSPFDRQVTSMALKKGPMSKMINAFLHGPAHHGGVKEKG